MLFCRFSFSLFSSFLSYSRYIFSFYFESFPSFLAFFIFLFDIMPLIYAAATPPFHATPPLVIILTCRWYEAMFLPPCLMSVLLFTEWDYLPMPAAAMLLFDDDVFHFSYIFTTGWIFAMPRRAPYTRVRHAAAAAFSRYAAWALRSAFWARCRHAFSRESFSRWRRYAALLPAA